MKSLRDLEWNIYHAYFIDVLDDEDNIIASFKKENNYWQNEGSNDKFLQDYNVLDECAIIKKEFGNVNFMIYDEHYDILDEFDKKSKKNNNKNKICFKNMI